MSHAQAFIVPSSHFYMNKCCSQYKNKITRENEVETDNSYYFMKKCTQGSFKIQKKKDSDYGYE